MTHKKKSFFNIHNSVDFNIKELSKKKLHEHKRKLLHIQTFTNDILIFQSNWFPVKEKEIEQYQFSFLSSP